MARVEPVDRALAAGEQARVAGRSAVASIRRSVSERLADLILSDPDWAAQAADVGLVDRSWLDDPAGRPFRTVPPTEMVERFLERTTEQRPSVLASMGLNAIQALSLFRSTPADEAVPELVTVMFTDLEGFTRFTADFGDEAAVALVTEHNRQIGPIVRSRGGRVVKRLGDGLMLTFSTPEAAVLAGLELVEETELPLRLRAGIHVGEAVITPDDIVGNAVNTAARITEEAPAGGVLASVDVRAAVRDEADGMLRGVSFGRARRYRLKGLEPVSLCRVERDG